MILETKNLSKTFGKNIAVNRVNIQINKGSFSAFLGPNGAGKSTTIQMLLDILEPSTGEVIYPSKVRTGVVFQQSVLDDLLTVKENLSIRAGQYHANEIVNLDQLIKQLGLENFVNQKYGTLSGGQKRRVDIARALLNQPEILFLDEPTTGLDIQTRNAIWKLLKQIQKESEMTIILTTHYLDETEEADQVYIIDQGNIMASGSAKDIIKQYAKHELRLKMNPEFDPQAQLNNKCLTSETEEWQVIKLNSSQEALEILSQFKDDIIDFEFGLGTMDDAFIAITGKEMR